MTLTKAANNLTFFKSLHLILVITGFLAVVFVQTTGLIQPKSFNKEFASTINSENSMPEDTVDEFEDLFISSAKIEKSLQSVFLFVAFAHFSHALSLGDRAIPVPPPRVC